jgi:hypothetical protein
MLHLSVAERNKILEYSRTMVECWNEMKRESNNVL